jgi:hypothetical protein
LPEASPGVSPSHQEAQSDPLPDFTPPFRVEYESYVYPVHTLEYLEKPSYCAWGLKNRGDCVQEPLNKRKFGDEIVLSNWEDAELLDILSRQGDVHILIPFRRQAP